GQGGYVGTFRAMTYTSVPYFLFVALNSLIQAAAPDAGIVGGLLGIAGMIWSFVLLVFAFQYIHELSGGAAFGAAFIPSLILFILLIVFVVLVGMAFLGALMGAMAGMPHPGAGNPSFPQGFPGSNPSFPPSPNLGQ